MSFLNFESSFINVASTMAWMIVKIMTVLLIFFLIFGNNCHISMCESCGIIYLLSATLSSWF